MNSTYGLTAANFLHALPPVLQEDEGMQALATAVADILETRTAEIDRLRIYPDIDSLPEDLLDILADDFKIDWYNYDYPLDAKRNLVKSHWYVHRHLGTTGAVRKAVQGVYPRSDVEEWWQDFYNGDPYHFRVVLEAAYPIIPVANTEILRVIEIYKSYRSHLDGVIYRSTANLIIKTGCQWIIYSGRFCGTYPVIARQGSIEDHNIVVRTKAQGIGHGAPLTGEVISGTYPAPAELGQITEGMVVVRTADGHVIYQNPATGEILSGEFPEISAQGAVESGTITASSAGQGTPYNGVLCGGGLKFYQ